MRFLKQKLRNQKGQSVLEYMLVLCVIVSCVLLVLNLLKNSEFFYKKYDCKKEFVDKLLRESLKKDSKLLKELF